jgi:hypothetical protein
MKALKVSPHSSSFGSGAPVFEVESDGGQVDHHARTHDCHRRKSWTRIKPGSHQLEVSIEIEAGSGWRVTNAYIGVPNADFGGTSGQSDATLRLGGGEDVKSLKFVKICSFDTDDLGRLSLHATRAIIRQRKNTLCPPRPTRGSTWASNPISKKEGTRSYRRGVTMPAARKPPMPAPRL